MVFTMYNEGYLFIQGSFRLQKKYVKSQHFINHLVFNEYVALFSINASKLIHIDMLDHNLMNNYVYLT